MTRLSNRVGRTPASAPAPLGRLCGEIEGRRGRRPRSGGTAPHRTMIALGLILSAFVLHAEPADTIYTARYVVTMNARRDLIDDGAVAVRGQRIVGVGKDR